MPPSPVAGLLLAAGGGRRMGRPKAAVEVDGEALLVRAVRALAAAGVTPTVVVLGAGLPGVADVRHGSLGLPQTEPRGRFRGVRDCANESPTAKMKTRPAVSAKGKSFELRGIFISFLYFSNWRRGWDSNPRYGSPYTAFPVLPVQPLLHLSLK